MNDTQPTSTRRHAAHAAGRAAAADAAFAPGGVLGGAEVPAVTHRNGRGGSGQGALQLGTQLREHARCLEPVVQNVTGGTAQDSFATDTELRVCAGACVRACVIGAHRCTPRATPRRHTHLAYRPRHRVSSASRHRPNKDVRLPVAAPMPSATPGALPAAAASTAATTLSSAPQPCTCTANCGTTWAVYRSATSAGVRLPCSGSTLPKYVWANERRGGWVHAGTMVAGNGGG
jgi:hypothetical protein